MAELGRSSYMSQTKIEILLIINCKAFMLLYEVGEKIIVRIEQGLFSKTNSWNISIFMLKMKCQSNIWAYD